MRGRLTDLSTRCWCNQPGGCRLVLPAGPVGRVCAICHEAGHRPLALASVNRARERNGLPEVAR